MRNSTLLMIYFPHVLDLWCHRNFVYRCKHCAYTFVMCKCMSKMCQDEPSLLFYIVLKSLKPLKPTEKQLLYLSSYTNTYCITYVFWWDNLKAANLCSFTSLTNLTALKHILYNELVQRILNYANKELLPSFITQSWSCPLPGITSSGCDSGWCHAPVLPLLPPWHLIMFGMALTLFNGCWYKCNVTARSFHMACVWCCLYTCWCDSVTALFTCQNTRGTDLFGSLLSAEVGSFWIGFWCCSLFLFIHQM